MRYVGGHNARTSEGSDIQAKHNRESNKDEDLPQLTARSRALKSLREAQDTPKVEENKDAPEPNSETNADRYEGFVFVLY